MSDPKFTKAPWLLAGDGSPFVYALNKYGTNEFFLSVQKGTGDDDEFISEEKAKSIAKLIAAAPDLYAALSEADEIFDESWYTDKQLVMRIKAALKKARGE
jgi:hypothetical protein